MAQVLAGVADRHRIRNGYGLRAAQFWAEVEQLRRRGRGSGMRRLRKSERGRGRGNESDNLAPGSFVSCREPVEISRLRLQLRLRLQGKKESVDAKRGSRSKEAMGQTRRHST